MDYQGNRRIQRDLPRFGDLVEAFYRLPSDSAPGGVDRSQNIDVVVGVEKHPKVPHDIFDLFPLKETLSSAHPIRDIGIEKRFLDKPRLAVRSDEDPEGVVTHTFLVRQELDLFGDEHRLFLVGVGKGEFDQVTRFDVRPEFLEFPIGVVRDYRVGGLKDLGRLIGNFVPV